VINAYGTLKPQPDHSVSWGLVGASTIASEYVIPAIRSLRGQAVRGVFSSNPTWGENFASVHSIPQTYPSLEALLSDSKVDAVYVSTTNERHAKAAMVAAKAGKHVLCEKPLAVTIDLARQVVEAASEARVVLATNHHLPNASTHRAVRELVRSGRLGEILAVRIFHARELPEGLRTWRTSAKKQGAGVCLDITVHDAALIDFLFEEDLVSVTALAPTSRLSTDEVEDAVMGVFETASGIHILFHDAWTVPHAGTGLEVHGTLGSVFATGVMTSDPVGDVALRTNDRTESVKVFDREDLYRRAMRHFASAIHGLGPPAVSGMQGANAVAVALATRQSTTERASIPIRLPYPRKLAEV
jgi:1,5-anhydro-D-fructose reductase (1,5-anhydro-D-mannitol-forming)